MSEHPTQPGTTPAPAGPPPHVVAALDRLDSVVAHLRSNPSDPGAPDLWKSAHHAIRKTKADQVRAGRAIAERNIEALAELARQARAAGDAPARRAPVPPPVPAPAAAAPPPATTTPPGQPPTSGAAPAHPGTPPQAAEISPDVLKHALAAFKKRLKLTRLDDESRLGVGKRAMTGGRKSAVVGIIPPNQYPRAVWEELANQGKLKRSGSGFYELVE